MNSPVVNSARIRAAWQGRVSGCLLGKPLEVLSFQDGHSGLTAYLKRADALPLRDYVPLIKGTLVELRGAACCRDNFNRAEPDDDINYTVLALSLIEEHGLNLKTADVARAWLRLLPAGTTWTAEREAYRTLLNNMDAEFVNGADPGFDLAKCSDNKYNEWIGAQIRADLYGWVCPGRPAVAAELARNDAQLSHRGVAVDGAAFIAALGAAIPTTSDLNSALDQALEHIAADSQTAAAIRFARQLEATPDAVNHLHKHFAGLSPVHALNNLAVVVWALNSADGDFAVAVGNAVTAGWDTDCNGATVGGLFGLTGAPIPDSWTRPWNGRVGVDLAGQSEWLLDDLVDRTIAAANDLATQVIA